ncbi:MULTISPECIES: TAT-variant-translocated molybdopterin oxidoreductase [unclassified Methylobacterium]|jgi:molybdopterin-containing oxidoreductase family iron-sulfur binding subunit|uniref:TAT-variant-translocated molybdopterin oxidoreductase n=1 Tax=unclassified Methylobacterium TaxID=2615210 RepID=UPI001353FD9C|nr:TAT-variant-translocated molybdopterin oxidoreductase [Methylobacterium sp. 2A]MWV21177.1 4Fe-4S dicluster domain-containing protein [Methylobacterium sp. 2A]
MTRTPDLAALREKLAGGDGPRFWRSLDAVADSPEFRDYLAAEFPSAARLAAAPERRGFLKLMAASFALGGLTACGAGGGRDYEVPYVRQPERIVPGTDLSYASSSVFDGFGNGVLVTTRNGRPLKIEGNPDHPWSRGGTDVLAQASVLGLYDPFRSQAVQHLGRPSSWAAFRADLQAQMPAWRENRGEGLALLTGPVTSPTLAAQIARLRAAYPALRWHVGAGAARDGLYEGARRAYGRPLETIPDFGRARTIVSLDGDFLDLGPGQVGLSRRWIDARRAAYAEGRLLALHAAAPTPTLTSAKADHGVVVPAGRLEDLARDLLAMAGGGAAPGGDDPVARWARGAGTALTGARGAGIVTAGLTAGPDLHDLVHRLNGALGNTGATLRHAEPAAEQGAGTLAELAEAMERGTVKALIVLGANPVYEAPGALDFAARMARVPLKIHAGLYDDETGARADWHLPIAHPLESWGDVRSLDGTVGLIQPTVAPLYNGRTLPQMLAFLAGGGDDEDALALVKARWRNDGEDEAAFEARFSEALRRGFWADSAPPAETVALTQNASPAPTHPASGIEVLFRPDPTVWDGTHADLAWLQELPKPLTKVVWENVVAVSPRLAEREGITTGDVLRIEAAGRAVEGPAWILPGQADDTVTLTLGYGRDVPDHLSRGLGYDAGPLRPVDASWRLAGARLTKTGAQRQPVTTQHLGTMEGQDLVRVQALGAAPVGDPKGAPSPASFYPPPESQDRWVAAQWGMAIDLDACIGCNACVTACQAENNIPVVGREEVALGRWMGWLRVDRYYAGELDAPSTHFQPVPCMHCEQAPCELGCPVEATLHDSEGLNLQVYNRCVGTRTCQSYCPYKVRRFNYLDYTGGMTPVEQQQRNPEVTVRSRGVMEKCTYCIQRITAARITSAKDAHAPIPDGAVETACQGACPTRAITFGNVADPGSQVSAARRDPREYALLGHLNTRPRTTYLAGLAPAADPGGREG